MDSVRCTVAVLWTQCTLLYAVILYCNSVCIAQGIHSVLEFACVGGNPDIVRLILGHMQFQEGDCADEVLYVYC